MADQLRSTLGQMLARADLPQQGDLAIAAADVFAIVKGMVDAAGEREEVDDAKLQNRVLRAVLGYLGTSLP